MRRKAKCFGSAFVSGAFFVIVQVIVHIIVRIIVHVIIVIVHVGEIHRKFICNFS